MHKTPFHQFHLDHGAKMVDFAGWEMPLHYGSIIDEHQAVRTSAGIFDVSHMGRIRFTGRQARRFLETLCTRRLSDMKVGQVRYTLVCNERGGVRDDVLIYRFDDHWLMVCNASNRAKLLEHFKAVAGDMAVKWEDQTQDTAMVALQGPHTMDIIGRFSKEIPTMKRYTFTVKNLLILKMIVSRTGYTGENGVEVILPARMLGMAMKLLMKETDTGEPPFKPAGLGARDSLRLEAGMPLYGHELTEDMDPISAGLGWAVSLDKDQDTEFGDPVRFIGHDALARIAAEGPARKLVGLQIEGRRTPRQHMAVKLGDKAIGEVTSGCLSPTLGYPIAMAYVDADQSNVGNSVDIDFGRETAKAQVVAMPFYKHP